MQHRKACRAVASKKMDDRVAVKIRAGDTGDSWRQGALPTRYGKTTDQAQLWSSPAVTRFGRCMSSAANQDRQRLSIAGLGTILCQCDTVHVAHMIRFSASIEKIEHKNDSQYTQHQLEHPTGAGIGTRRLRSRVRQRNQRRGDGIDGPELGRDGVLVVHGLAGVGLQVILVDSWPDRPGHRFYRLGPPPCRTDARTPHWCATENPVQDAGESPIWCKAPSAATRPLAMLAVSR